MATKKINHIDIPHMPVKKSFNAEQRRFFKNKIEELRRIKVNALSAKRQEAISALGHPDDIFRETIGKMSAEKLKDLLFKGFCRYMNSRDYKQTAILEWRLLPYSSEVENADSIKSTIEYRGVLDLGIKITVEREEKAQAIKDKYEQAIKAVNKEASRIQESLLFAGMPQELLAMIRAFEAFEVKV